jgi:NADPH-dependent 2,4-dienoyl-CoA reductase/sulfur reductase-like enzyme
MASGVAPRGELAVAAKLELKDGAVAVDASMRTSHPTVLAAGDVCLAENAGAGRRLRVEHWGEALIHGEIAGRTAAGQDVAWSDVPGFWSTIGRRALKYVAWGDGFDTEHFERRGEDGGFVVSYGREGKLVGVLCHQADRDYERGREAIGRGAPWPS